MFQIYKSTSYFSLKIEETLHKSFVCFTLLIVPQRFISNLLEFMSCWSLSGVMSQGLRLRLWLGERWVKLASYLPVWLGVSLHFLIDTLLRIAVRTHTVLNGPCSQWLKHINLFNYLIKPMSYGLHHITHPHFYRWASSVVKFKVVQVVAKLCLKPELLAAELCAHLMAIWDWFHGKWREWFLALCLAHRRHLVKHNC